jgi:hypothetical protein
MLHVYEDVPRDARAERKRLLSHIPRHTELSDLPSDKASPMLPLGNPFRVVLAGAGRHPSSCG